MHAHGKRLLFLLLGCSLTVSLQAQDAGTLPNLEPPPDSYQVERLTAQDGLPSSSIVDVEQDEAGFLWFAGQQGLFRYDGYTFKAYQSNPDDTTALAAGWVEALHIDPKGTLWAGTFSGGLNRFNAETETFTAFRYDPDDETSLSHDTVTVMLTDSRGTFWVGTHNGLNRFDPETETFTRFQHDPDDETTLSNNQVRVLYEDRQGTLWVGTGSPSLPETPLGEGGLNRFHPETGTFTRYLHDPADPNSLLRNKITALYEDTDGTFWVGTLAQGLHTMDRERGTFTRWRMDPQNPDRLKLPYQHADFVDPRTCLAWDCGIVSFIHEDRSGILWIGDHGAGITRYNRATGTMVPFEPDATNPNSLSSDEVWDIHETRDGSLWVSSWGGISKITPSRQHFRTLLAGTEFVEGGNDEVESIYVSPREPGVVWIGKSYGQLLRYEADRGNVTRFDLDPGTTRRFPVRAMEEDQQGNLWIGAGQGTEGRLYRFDRATGRYASFAHDPSDPTSLSRGYVRALLVGQAGTLWVGTIGYEGENVNRFNPASETFTRYSLQSVSQIGTSIQALFEDAEGEVWVATDFDLIRFDREQETFTAIERNLEPRAFAEDPSGQLWIGSQSSGLWLLDRAAAVLTRVPGLPDSFIKWVELDDRGYLWVAMQNALARYDPTSGGVRVYGVADGLPAGRLSRAHAWTDQGEIVFGYESGAVMAFDPYAFEINETPPQVRITGVATFEESFAVNNPSITLPYDQNDLTFAYVGLHYGDPSQNQYRYRLEDYDRDWVEAGSQRSVRYPRLPPGDYTFRVSAANSDGVWNEDGAAVRVVIRPPWWQAWWAYLLYGLLFLGGVFAVDRFQRRRLIRKERERAMQRELEQKREIEKAHTELKEAHTHLKTTQAQLIQAEKMASLGQLTAGIAHEIKNPLNFVNNFADLNEELATDLAEELAHLQDHLPPDAADNFKETLSYIQVNAAKIREQGQRADGIVQSMMQHASGGAGQREATDVNALVAEYAGLAYHGKRAQVPDFNVDLQQDLSAEVGAVAMVPQDVGRVVSNLLSNAFDAVHEMALSVNGAYEPTVSVSTRRTGNTVEIRVRDNGAGIDKNLREKIFEPFFTTKPTGSGTGLGLSLSYDIVTQGHGGTLTVESEAGQGTSFVVTLPGKINRTA